MARVMTGMGRSSDAPRGVTHLLLKERDRSSVVQAPPSHASLCLDLVSFGSSSRPPETFRETSELCPHFKEEETKAHSSQ